MHPIHIGLRGQGDHVLLVLALAQDRIIVTANGRDYRRLLEREPVKRDEAWRMILAALSFIELNLDPLHFMIKRVVEVSRLDCIRAYERPATRSASP